MNLTNLSLFRLINISMLIIWAKTRVEIMKKLVVPSGQHFKLNTPRMQISKKPSALARNYYPARIQTEYFWLYNILSFLKAINHAI